MALKRKITKEEFEALADHFKAEYKEHNGGYILDTDEATELETALRRQSEENRSIREQLDALKAEKDEAEAARIAAEEEAARKKGDTTALEASWQAKLDKEKKDGEARENKLKDKLKDLLVRDVARSIAEEISTVPEVILPHIERRLSAEYADDAPKTRVLDAAGAPSALTVEELKQEFVANDKFAAIIIGSKANGGQSGQARGTGQPGAKKIQEMNDQERIELHKQLGPDEFSRRVEAERTA